MAPVALTKELEQKARVLALVGDPTRIRILKLLDKKTRVNVSDIALEISMNIACVSHHLQLMKDNGLVETERNKNSIYYSISDKPFVKNLIALIK